MSPTRPRPSPRPQCGVWKQTPWFPRAGRRDGGAEAAGLPGAEQREEAAGIAPGSEKTPLSRALTGACRNVADPADETPPQLP